MIKLRDLLLKEEGQDPKELAKQLGLSYSGWGKWKDNTGADVAKTINGQLVKLDQPEPPSASDGDDGEGFYNPEQDVNHDVSVGSIPDDAMYPQIQHHNPITTTGEPIPTDAMYNPEQDVDHNVSVGEIPDEAIYDPTLPENDPSVKLQPAFAESKRFDIKPFIRR